MLLAAFLEARCSLICFSDVNHSDRPGQLVNNFQKSSHDVVIVISYNKILDKFIRLKSIQFFLIFLLFLLYLLRK